MAKRSPQPIGPKRSLSRKGANISPLPVLYIFSEGKVTEPDYINSFYRDCCKVRRVALGPIVKAAGVPMTLVEKCVAKKAELAREARVDPLEKNSLIWAVFDVDEHPRLDEALAFAHKNGINCAVSNPCIEVWGLMHLSPYERPSTRHQAQAELAKVMPGYHHDDSPIFPWAICRNNVDIAIKNSTTVMHRRTEEGVHFPRGNPTSSFHDLLIAIRGDSDETESIG